MKTKNIKIKKRELIQLTNVVYVYNGIRNKTTAKNEL